MKHCSSSVLYINCAKTNLFICINWKTIAQKHSNQEREREIYFLLSSKVFLDSNPHSKKKSFLCLSDYFFPVSFTSFGQLWTERQKRNKKRERLKRGWPFQFEKNSFQKERKEKWAHSTYYIAQKSTYY